jgi:hypothetical protein
MIVSHAESLSFFLYYSSSREIIQGFSVNYKQKNAREAKTSRYVIGSSQVNRFSDSSAHSAKANLSLGEFHAREIPESEAGLC